MATTTTTCTTTPPPPPPTLCKITFRVRAQTNFGDTLVLVGSGPMLGDWDPTNKGIRLTTTPEDYPVWSTPVVEVTSLPLEFKYVRLLGDGGVEWEAEGANREVSPSVVEQAGGKPMAKNGAAAAAGPLAEIIIDGGDFARIHPDACFGHIASLRPGLGCDIQGKAGGPHLLVLGDKVAGGYGAWGLKGWLSKLVPKLQEKFGYGVSARVAGDIDVHKAAQEFPLLLSGCPAKPQVVLLAFGAGLSHVATCPDWDREATCTSFLQAHERLITQIFAAGALPVVAGLCPNGNCGEEQTEFWRRTNDGLRGLSVPFLDWLHLLAKSYQDAAWAEGLGIAAEIPSGAGHTAMLGAVDVDAFDPERARAVLGRKAEEVGKAKLCFSDGNGFEILYTFGADEVSIRNNTLNEYQLNAGWDKLQDSMAAARAESPWALPRGLYISYDGKAGSGACTSLALDISGRIASSGDETVIPAGTTVVLQAAKNFVAGSAALGLTSLFEAGPLRILRDEANESLVILNEASFEYNVHPMWNEARLATRRMPQGIYEDPSGRPFRTAIISLHGLQSRIKIPGGTAILLKRTGDLSSVERVALLPLGDRCSIRMLLHKIELDGPCYPFDLTRTTGLGDVADMVGSGFADMWREELLHYDHDAGRVFHKKWGGLSFAHEVDDGDDPVNNFGAIAKRMAKRYAGRSARFDFACKHSDRVMFIRTGCASRGEVENLLVRLKDRYPGLKMSLLLISDQNSGDFHGIEGFSHVCEAFDPDRMYEDMNYWINCSHRFRGILEGFGINARSLYWCPNNLKEAENEMREAGLDEVPTPPVQKDGDAADAAAPFLSREVPKFSHSCLFDLEKRSAAPGGSGAGGAGGAAAVPAA